MPLFIPVLIALIAVGSSAAAVVFWNKVIKWATEHVFPWVDSRLPALSETVRVAFATIDKIAAPAYKVIRDAWQELRERLVRLVVVFERAVDGNWARDISSYFVTPEEPDRVQRVRDVQYVDWSEIPKEVRAAWVQRQQGRYEIDVTELRDAEMDEKGMQLEQ